MARDCSAVTRDKHPHHTLLALGEAERPHRALMASLGDMQRSQTATKCPTDFTERLERWGKASTCHGGFTEQALSEVAGRELAV
ncbi:hypothetical protein [Bifidobacterium sp. UTBIF-68]|uniref:hypothetical protein n=1 Tax=Bifidobacterium sp. UTBIF-68 TaxID=1465262 RepID=UPI0015E2D49A|nr:hypothetical protein [Bifidobacterium sp. UTBIF-68]